MSCYIPPKIWQWEQSSGGTFSGMNRPISGARFEQSLPKGTKPLQLYSLGTPNGVKITIMLEELRELGIAGIDYDLFKIDIRNGEQFGSEFVNLNPNSKIPVLLDQSISPAQPVFESGAILLYLAEKFSVLLPTALAKRTECLSWLFWQMASTPYLGGGLGHFYHYAPEKLEYPINRFAMEIKRQLDLLDKHLAERTFICGDEYSIADIAIWSWYGQVALGISSYNLTEFLETDSYKNLIRWSEQIYQRPAVVRGKNVEYLPII
ncbi:GST-like protein [Nicoletella semolina]|uniref:GST-like protein n=1 Tax=Nicoletella semolina TaxID=271160 RepID=A0A4R2N8P1_9PAST|nr:glutathione-dependent disulfide-bond oxidoreductase [Nicoletella semolina]MDH2924515.1 glutathione-dependent disulfide-bond oxidoreductase [Nicoletella semolina]TCP17357.1 GST-like protein [Nicoletella semolina]